MQDKIGVAVITYRAKDLLPTSLPPLLKSSIPTKVLVVNSSSNDGTVELAKAMGADTLVVPRNSFNHGTTREVARKALGTEIVVMTTPDAIAVDNHVIEKLVQPLLTKEASASYARQLPHNNADLFESFPREFNYPPKSHIRSLQEVRDFGSYLFFFSDSFAAYRNDALDSIGGFSSVLTGEDTVAIAKLLHAGHKIAYRAEAEVKHSHRYTLLQEFKRYFDTGLAREGYKNLLEVAGTDDKRGKEFALSLLRKTASERPHLIPYATLHILSKWLGYKIGQKSLNAPHSFKKWMSSQDFYWLNHQI
ncbi:MAG: glycosyltransferase [Parachlamydiaceae bacterium]